MKSLTLWSDIRNAYYYSLGHIDGAINIPYYNLVNNYGHYLNKYDRYYMYCDNGSTSMSIVNRLNLLGYDTVSVNVSTFDLYNNVECNDNSNTCNLKIIEGENEFYSALSNKETGNYVVKYEARDAYGNKTTKNRVIEITS